MTSKVCVEGEFETRSYKNFAFEIKNSIYFENMFVALVIQLVMRMRHIDT
jgi:hypothetical protein